MQYIHYPFINSRVEYFVNDKSVIYFLDESIKHAYFIYNHMWQRKPTTGSKWNQQMFD